MINETPYNVKFIRAKKIEDAMSMKATQLNENNTLLQRFLLLQSSVNLRPMCVPQRCYQVRTPSILK